MVLEGMAAGLAVIATPTGGTPEILADGTNGLSFAPGDAADLARQVDRLAADAGLCRRLALAGQQTVRQKFTTGRMLDEIEDLLTCVAAGAPPPASRAA
jgi:glycosyltransferase involved in cell wall biosynthesis